MSGTSWIWSAPRWAKVGPFVKDAAVLCGLKYSVDIDKGWITERGRVEVSGEEEGCRRFIEVCNRAMDNFNKD